MQSFFFVFIGGGLGSICRYGLARLFVLKDWNFPLATLVANTLACLVLGYLIGLGLKNNLSDTAKWLLVTGFCGGFSTFSTFSAETYLLLQEGHLATAFWNIAGSLLLCLVCIFIGLKMAN